MLNNTCQYLRYTHKQTEKDKRPFYLLNFGGTSDLHDLCNKQIFKNKENLCALQSLQLSDSLSVLL